MRTFVATSLTFLICLAGCGSSAEPDTFPVVTPDVTSVDFTMAWLGGPLDECQGAERRIQYERSTRELRWESCFETSSRVATQISTQLAHVRTLSESEAVTLEEALNNIRYEIQTESDGLDGLVLVMTTHTANGIAVDYKAWCYNSCPEGRKAPNAKPAYEMLIALTGEPQLSPPTKHVNFDGRTVVEFEEDILGYPSDSCESKYYAQRLRYWFESGQLEWESCAEADARNASNRASPLTNARLLREGERDSLLESLKKITYSDDSKVGGFDGHSWTMTVDEGEHFTPSCINTCGERKKAPRIADTLALLSTLAHL